jgi:ATP-dependent DNA helicase RecG
MSDIKKLIAKGECKTVEFKAALPKGDNLSKTVIAFSNMAGGKIVMGVEDKTGRIIGINDNEAIDFPDKISNIIYDRCNPSILPEIYVVQINGATVLVVEIFPGPLKPYYLKKKGKRDGTYIRVGATNKLADMEMLIDLERQRRNISLDEEVDYDKDESSIHFEQLQRDFQKYTGKKLIFNDLLTLQALKKDKKKFHPTVGGLLIAGKEEYFEYSRIKCARFKGNDVGEFIDQKEFAGPLYEQVENAMKFAMIYIAKAGIVKGLQRIDTYEIPLEAIREALVNAVVHRDYSISGADIKFAVFDDRIEITSPGALPKALEIEDILSGRSEIRNKVIARFFKEIHFIEQWGTGIKKILKACKSAGIREPEFRESGLFFKVILYKNKKEFEQVIHDIENDRLRDNRQTSWEPSLKSSLKTSQKILEIMKENQLITIQELSALLGISDRAIKNNINKLKKQDLIKRIGPAKGGRWEVNEEA